METAVCTSVSHLSWNVGGVSLTSLESGLLELQARAEGSVDVVSLQEMARDHAGWGFHQIHKWFVYSYRDEHEWRGSAIGYRSDVFTLMRKKASPKGLWVRLRRIEDGAELWCGSCYFSQGASRETHANEVHSFLDVLPPTSLPVLCGGDMNTPVRWSQAEGESPLPSGPESKGDYMLGVFSAKGLAVTAPTSTQWTTPTSRPRRSDATGRQIDMVATKHCSPAPAFIHEGSHLYLGTCDHDAVSQTVYFSHRQGARSRYGGSGPRVVVATPAFAGDLSQGKMEHLAKKYTRPRQGQAYSDPEDVKALFRLARAGHRAEDWKTALKARARARTVWQEGNIRQATEGNWGLTRL